MYSIPSLWPRASSCSSPILQTRAPAIGQQPARESPSTFPRPARPMVTVIIPGITPSLATRATIILRSGSSDTVPPIISARRATSTGALSSGFKRHCVIMATAAVRSMGYSDTKPRERCANSNAMPVYTRPVESIEAPFGAWEFHTEIPVVPLRGTLKLAKEKLPEEQLKFLDL
jgi:hypothetical protein